MTTYLVTRTHGLMTHLLPYEIMDALSSAENSQEIIDILTPSDYGKSIQDLDSKEYFALERAFSRKLIERCDFVLRAAPNNIKEFLLAYYQRFEIQNILRILRSKISKEGFKLSERSLFPLRDFSISTIDIKKISEADDVEKAIDNLEKSPYQQVLRSLEWYQRYDSLLPIEFYLKKIYYNNLFKAFDNIPGKDKETVSRLIRTEVDIVNCFTSVAASLYGYAEELIESLLIPFPLKITLNDLIKVVRTESPHEIQSLFYSYKNVIKFLLVKNEPAAQIEALRLLRNKVIGLKVSSSMNFTFVMCYLLLCEFEYRDLNYIVLARKHNIDSKENLITRK